MFKDCVRTLAGCFWRNLPWEMSSGNDRKVPDSDLQDYPQAAVGEGSRRCGAFPKGRFAKLRIDFELQYRCWTAPAKSPSTIG